MCIRDSIKLAEEHGLKIIEDAAELIGQTYKGKLCGSFGEVSTFSFYPNKHITCLLYTSDAADERSSVDLGGRRIIKKKQK